MKTSCFAVSNHKSQILRRLTDHHPKFRGFSARDSEVSTNEGSPRAGWFIIVYNNYNEKSNGNLVKIHDLRLPPIVNGKSYQFIVYSGFLLFIMENPIKN